jgi:hypothetical protein
MKKLIIVLCLILTSWFGISLSYSKLVDYFVIPVLIAIVAGLITNILQDFFEQKNKLYRYNRKLSKYVGEYDVYHWNNLSRPDACDYKIHINLDHNTGILTITQTGHHAYDALTANIKMDELTLSYGEGLYVHPQKEKNPFGRIQLFLISDTIINVDKTYMDIKEGSIFLPAAEKWQWRKL